MYRRRLYIFLVLILLVFMILLSVGIGSVDIGFKDIFWILVGKREDRLRDIILLIRLPRTIGAAICGMALAVVGTFFQGLLRNPMADPYILGVSSGSALGATIAIVFNMGIVFVNLLSFVMGVLVTFFVYFISSLNGRSSTYTMILVGVAVSSFAFSFISLFMFIKHEQIAQIVMWIMGSFSLVGWSEVSYSAPIIIAGSFIMYLFSRDLNAIITGEESAEHLGIDVEVVRRILLFTGSVVTASCVSVSGIVGFVGLITPHISRLLVGPDNRILVPFSGLMGGSFMVLADILSRTVIKPAEVPVGVITAIFGAPFFLYLLMRVRRGE
ncbi:MAG: FecCD family ABC transporter permease [Thermosulfidibacteraceae bacterium]|jgi:iron complex transport system permease protein